jgi:methionyl-tRNA formyltransferase
MRTVVIGNRKLARHLLKHTLENDWEVVGAIVPQGELAAKQANYTPVSDLVSETDCQLHQTNDINSSDTFEWLQSVTPEVCFCGGWSQIIERRVLEIPDEGFLGFHSSHLPEGRGGAPVNWSLINGADQVWISLFYYEPGVDSGDVLTQGSVSVEKRDDIGTVFNELASEACRLVSTIRKDLESGSVDATPQSLQNATYRPRRQPQDGLINWDRDPKSQYDWVRAQTKPYPGAYTFYNGKKVVVWDGKPIERPTPDSLPGEILAITSGRGIDVRTGDGTFRITRMKAGSQPSRWADRYAREVGISVGDQFGHHHAPENWIYTSIQGTEDPTTFDTNLEVADTGKVVAMMYSGSPTDIDVSASLNEDIIFEESITLHDKFQQEIKYTPMKIGTHTLEVRFETENEQIDTRYLKVFVHE